MTELQRQVVELGRSEPFAFYEIQSEAARRWRAVKDLDGREMVEALLVQYERQLLRMFPDAPPAPT